MIGLGEFGGQTIFIGVTIAGVLAGLWVYYDASSRSIDNPVLWATVVLFLFIFYAVPGIVALIAYLVLRPPRDDTE